MIPVQFDYVAPDDMADVVRSLSQNGNARVLAGGLSLLPAMTLGRATPALLVDLRKVSGLTGIGQAPAGGVRIGAMATYDAVAAALGSGGRYQALADAIRAIGDPQVRNRGTLAGSLASGDPGADLPAVALALGAAIRTLGPDGPRVIPADEFFVGPSRTALGPAEVITAIDFPLPAAGTGSAYELIKNPAGGYAVCGAAAAIVRTPDGRVGECRVALTGAADHAVRLPEVEGALEGLLPTSERLAASARRVRDEALTYRDDLAASAEYRAHLAEVLIERALAHSLQRAR